MDVPSVSGLPDLLELLETSVGQSWQRPGLTFAGRRRLRCSFFADKLDAAGLHIIVRSGFGPVAQVVRAHP